MFLTEARLNLLNPMMAAAGRGRRAAANQSSALMFSTTKFTCKAEKRPKRGRCLQGCETSKRWCCPVVVRTGLKWADVSCASRCVRQVHRWKPIPPANDVFSVAALARYRHTGQMTSPPTVPTAVRPCNTSSRWHFSEPGKLGGKTSPGQTLAEYSARSDLNSSQPSQHADGQIITVLLLHLDHRPPAARHHSWRRNCHCGFHPASYSLAQTKKCLRKSFSCMMYPFVTSTNLSKHQPTHTHT